MNITEQADKLLKAFRKNARTKSGFTMDNQGNLVNPSKGYAVAYQEAPLTQKGLVKALEANPNLYLGYWEFDGMGYTDLVNIIQDKAEAIQRGREANQLAIWGFAEGEEICL